MRDIIQLLPESIANQIAAGEVVQRPSSVVKELIENSVDAGASHIQVIVKEAGKNLIKVIDNGEGMSLTDARMCFERHATSKIRSAEDLFHIKTMGFRGEALASISAVSQVELKTKQKDDELGTLICIEGSKVIRQEAAACLEGTAVEVKNLFFNVPARRNFLKSNSVEMRHIIEEFQRNALSHPEIAFNLYQNDMEVYNLPPGKLVKRIVNIFGKNYQEQLVAVQEDTPHLKIKGYIGKPEFSKKTRGEQFVFVNNRYIKSNYLNHAVQTAYENLLPQEYYPFFVLFLKIDPEHIDVNVHPTKTEIKFIDERTNYGIIKSTVKQSLGQHNITPSLDFSYDVNIDLERELGGDESEKTNKDLNYERFRLSGKEASNLKHWEKLYGDPEEATFKKREDPFPGPEDLSSPRLMGSGINDADQLKTFSEKGKTEPGPVTFQVHGRYILCQVKSGLMMIDQMAASQRIAYERYLNLMTNKTATTQKVLFPVSIELNPSDFSLVMDIREEIHRLGFDFDLFGKNAIIINGIPSGLREINEKEVFEGLIEQYKWNKEKLELKIEQNLASSLARYSALKPGKLIDEEERKSLINQLFGCKNPNYSPFGDPTFYIFTLEQIQDYFKQSN